MKKIFIALMLCLISVCSFGQSDFDSQIFCRETVDEFGDKTGNLRVGVVAIGKFSNSATTNSCASLLIALDKDNEFVSLFEYCNNHPSRDDFSIKFEGTTTGENIFIPADYRFSYYVDDFIDLCRTNDIIKIRIREIGNYASMTAVFKIEKCKQLANLYDNPHITK